MSCSRKSVISSCRVFRQKLRIGSFGLEICEVDSKPSVWPSADQINSRRCACPHECLVKGPSVVHRAMVILRLLTPFCLIYSNLVPLPFSTSSVHVQNLLHAGMLDQYWYHLFWRETGTWFKNYAVNVTCSLSKKDVFQRYLSTTSSVELFLTKLSQISKWMLPYQKWIYPNRLSCKFENASVQFWCT